MYRDDLINALSEASLLAIKWNKFEISIREFVNQYGNFYHYEGLDGHEASDEQARTLFELREFIEPHGLIQNTVVDSVFFGDGSSTRSVEESGRIAPNEAETRLKKICTTYDFVQLINKYSN